MIIAKITGGLGNQLFQYAVGKAVADFHQVELKLDITAYRTYTLHNGCRLELFDITADIATDKEILQFKGSNSFFSKILRKIGMFQKSSYYSEKQRTIFDQNVFSFFDRYLDGYWQNEQYFLGIREKLIVELKSSNPISSNAIEYQSKINYTNSISLHVRRGDYLNHSEIGVLDVSYYQKAVKYLSDIIENPVFFVFSNDLEWCYKNFEFIEGNCIFVENTKSEIDDLVLMSLCKHNIVANSSFSWWGAWLNNNVDKIVVAPKKWMAVNPNEYKWVPNNWVEL
jgi:hypothetical protein